MFYMCVSLANCLLCSFIFRSVVSEMVDQGGLSPAVSVHRPPPLLARSATLQYTSEHRRLPPPPPPEPSPPPSDVSDQPCTSNDDANTCYAAVYESAGWLVQLILTRYVGSKGFRF